MGRCGAVGEGGCDGERGYLMRAVDGRQVGGEGGWGGEKVARGVRGTLAWSSSLRESRGKPVVQQRHQRQYRASSSWQPLMMVMMMVMPCGLPVEQQGGGRRRRDSELHTTYQNLQRTEELSATASTRAVAAATVSFSRTCTSSSSASSSS